MLSTKTVTIDFYESSTRGWVEDGHQWVFTELAQAGGRRRRLKRRITEKGRTINDAKLPICRYRDMDSNAQVQATTAARIPRMVVQDA